MTRAVLSLLALPALLTIAQAPGAAAQEHPSVAYWPGQPPQDRAPVYGYGYDDFRGAYFEARLWVEDDREIFQRGDRLRLRFRTSHDAYVAVVHIDTDGNLELVFPESAWDSEYVRAGRTYGLPRAGWDAFWTVRERPGIGYFHLVASSEPLDVRALRRTGSAHRDFVGIGSTVRGDPFWVLDRVTRLLVGPGAYGRVAVDTYGYQVGGRHRYPAYVCTDAYGVDYWDAGSYYGSCDRVLRLLRTEPRYYDTRRYRGDRSAYFRSAEPAVRHGYKESPTRERAAEPSRSFDRPSGTPAAPSGALPLRPTPTRPTPARPAPREEQRPSARPPSRQPAAPAPEARPSGERPRLERRPAEREPAARPSPPRQERPAPSAREPERPAPSPPAERPRRPDTDS